MEMSNLPEIKKNVDFTPFKFGLKNAVYKTC